MGRRVEGVEPHEGVPLRSRSPTSRAVSDIGFMVDTDKIDAVLDGNEPTVAPPFTADSVGAAGADVRGLAAVEHVLFERDPTEARRRARTRPPRPRWSPRSAADGVARPMDRRGRRTIRRTRPHVGSRATRRTPTAGRARRPRERHGDGARPRRPRSSPTPRAHRRASATPSVVTAATACRDTLWSVRAVYDGSPPATTRAPGSGRWWPTASVDADERFRSRLRRAATRSERSRPISIDARDRRDRRALPARPRSLGTITRAEVASILGVTLSLSDSDGDS